MSEFSRLTGVFFEPSKTFADIAERPRWFVPLLIVVLATVCFYALVNSHVGWQSLIEQQLSTPQMERMSPQQRTQMTNIYEKAYPIFFTVGPIIGMPVMYLLISAVLLGMASGIMSAGVRFKQIFAIMCYAALTTLVTRVLATVVMFLKPPDQYNVMNPLASNPAALMNPTTSSRFVYTLASGLDVIALWAMILTAVGLKAAAGKKLSFGGSLFAVFLPWAALMFLMAALAGMFS